MPVTLDATGPREEIVEYVPDRRLAWTVRGGSLPVRDYEVSVDLKPSADRTVTVWTGRFRPAVPGTGRAVQAMLRLALAAFARRLAAAAGRGSRRVGAEAEGGGT